MSHARRKQSPFQQFLSIIYEWIKRLGRKEARQPPGELEEVGDNGTLWRIRNNQPGVCACWWICHRHADHDLVVTLISLEQLRQDVTLYRGKPSPPQRAGFSNFTELDSYLEGLGLDKRFTSHIVILVWRSRIPVIARKDSHGQAYRTTAIKPIGAYPCDLQGLSNAWGSGDRFAIRVCEEICKRLLKMEVTLNPWEKIVNGIDWIEWLTFYAKRYFGESHVLQPRINR